jgi:hypothetical protein
MRTFRVHQSVLFLVGIEVGTGGLEVRRPAFADRVDVKSSPAGTAVRSSLIRTPLGLAVSSALPTSLPFASFNTAVALSAGLRTRQKQGSLPAPPPKLICLP